MTLTAFDSRLGTSQGRIRPSGAAAPAGDFLFVLGDDERGRTYDLGVGDYAEVTQDVDLTHADFVRLWLRLRCPDDVPAGLSWQASIRIDGVVFAFITARPGRDRTMTDLTANVSKLTGTHAVGIRLELAPE